MIDLLQRNFEQQQQFVSDASHELKTPLTVIESYANLLKRWGKDDQAIVDEAAEAIYAETKRMKGLTEQMLALATGEAETAHDFSTVRLDHIVKESTEHISQAFNRHIIIQNLEPLTVHGSAAQLKQLLFILLENAVKYSETDISIDGYATNSYALVEITDKGIGIPEAELQAIFERFYRVDKARTRATGGTGLGLAIAKKNSRRS